MTVQIDFCRVAHHQPLQAACPFIQARQAYKLVLDFLPVRVGINKEAVILVDRRHHMSVATGLDPLPVSGRNSQTPLGIQSHFGSPTEHVFQDGNGIGRGHTTPALTHLLPLFTTLLHYIRALPQRQQTVSINSCCTGT